MEEKNVTKISLSTFFLILAIIAIIVMGIFIYKLNNDKTAEIQKSTELQAQVDSLNRTVSDLNGKMNAISETINSNENISTSNLKTNESSQNTISKDSSITVDEKKFTNMISCVLDIKDFTNVDELKDEDYLYAVYRKIYRLNDAEYEKHINSDGEVLYSVEEINSYVQELFNKKLSKGSSTDLLKYKNGKYELLLADGDPVSYVRNINFVSEKEIVYATFDIYEVDVGDNEEKLGTYTATIVKDKSTGNLYINSKVKK